MASDKLVAALRAHISVQRCFFMLDLCFLLISVNCSSRVLLKCNWYNLTGTMWPLKEKRFYTRAILVLSKSFGSCFPWLFSMYMLAVLLVDSIELVRKAQPHWKHKPRWNFSAWNGSFPSGMKHTFCCWSNNQSFLQQWHDNFLSGPSPDPGTVRYCKRSTKVRLQSDFWPSLV